LPAHCGTCRDLRSETGNVVAQPTTAIEQSGYFARLGRRLAVDHDDVKSDPQIRQPARAPHCVVRRRASDHQACGVENAANMRGLDRGVDLFAEPEVIGGYDQMLQ